MREKLLELLATRNLNNVNDWLRSLKPPPDDERIQEEIAALHSDLNLFSLLNEITQDSFMLSIYLILESAKKVKMRTDADIYALSDYSRRVDGAFLDVVADEIAVSLKDRPEFAITLLGKIGEREEALDVALLAWTIAYARAFPDAAINFLHQFDTSPVRNGFLYVAMLMNLSRNPEFEDFVRHNHDEVITNIKKLSKEKPESHIAWQVLCDISEFSVEATVYLRNVISEGQVAIARAFLFKLATRNKKLVTVEKIPLSEFLKPILPIALQDNGISMQYGAILARLVTNKDTRDEVFSVMQYAEENLNLDLCEKFESLSHAIMDAELFSTLLTKRLMDKNSNPTALRNLLQFCIVGRAECDIDCELFVSAVFEQRRRMMARLIAYTHNGPSLCAFAAVLAESEKMQPDGLAIAKSIIEYITLEYPDSSEKFFLKKKKTKISSKNAASLYSSAMKTLVKSKNDRQALPSLDELRPSSSQHLAMIHQDIKTNREIGRAAEEKSIFSSIAKKVRILQGTKVATIMYDGRTSITKMGTMSYSIELPRSERADPVGGLIQRQSWLQGGE
ncbi:hypothetical protein [Duganella sp. LjRoot269]|uniref:hypothetical protein n=1 Tax=Duganella sp. LjRoot269 TaxID=3342305 RepID=UPI003ECE4DA8